MVLPSAIEETMLFGKKLVMISVSVCSEPVISVVSSPVYSMPEPGLTRFAPMIPTVPAISVVQAKPINAFPPSAPISLR